MIFEMLFDKPIMIISSFILVHLFIFYALGAVLQSYFSFRKSNSFLSIPLGYVSWQLLTLFLFFIPILFGLEKVWFELLGVIKDIMIIFVLLLYYKSWAPSFKVSNSRAVVRAPIGILITVIAILFLLTLNEYVPLNNRGDRLNAFIGFMKDDNFIFDSAAGNSENSIFGQFMHKNTLDIIESYETFYYWVAITQGSLDTLSNEQVANLIFAPMMTSIISFAILGSVVDSEKSFISYIYASILIFLVTLLEWRVGVNSQAFYYIPILVLSIMLMFTFSVQQVPSEGVLTASLASLLTLITVTHWAMPLIIIFGACILSLSIIKNGQLVRMMYQYAIALIIPILLYSVISLLAPLINSDDQLNFLDHAMPLIVVVVTAIIIAFPLKSLATSPERREDLVKFEESIKTNKATSLLLSALIVTGISMLLTFLLGHNIFEVLNDYFMSINNNLLVSILIYIVIALLPAVSILIFNYKTKRSSILNVIPFIVFLLNPATMAFIFSSTGWEYNWLIIFIPELIVFSMWLLEKVIKYTPDKIKI